MEEVFKKAEAMAEAARKKHATTKLGKVEPFKLPPKQPASYAEALRQPAAPPAPPAVPPAAAPPASPAEPPAPQRKRLIHPPTNALSARRRELIDTCYPLFEAECMRALRGRCNYGTVMKTAGMLWADVVPEPRCADLTATLASFCYASEEELNWASEARDEDLTPSNIIEVLL